MGKLGLLPLLLVVVAAVSSLSVYQVAEIDRAKDAVNSITVETATTDAKAILGASENEYVDYLLSKGWKRTGNVWNNGSQSIVVTEQIGIVTKVDILK